MLTTITLPGTDVALSEFCLGTAPFGAGLDEGLLNGLYEQFRAAGGNAFDTAHCYCFWLPAQSAGSSERMLGKLIKAHGDRKNVVIVTKGGHPSVPPAYQRPAGYLSPEVLNRDIAESLEFLGYGTIDIYLLHRDDRRVPVGEILDTLNRHVAAGRLRVLGVSNWTMARIAEANAYAKAHGMQGFAISEPQFSLAHVNAPEPTDDGLGRYLYDADIAWHERSGLPIMCYSPTANGYFATGGQSAKGSFDNPITQGRLARATALANKLGATPNQIALAYLRAQRFPVVPILGTTNPEHLADALGAARLRLTPEQVAYLRAGAAGA
jgi:aryl-alcohol dehydrogenase-like predicted oxidoreductase